MRKAKANPTETMRQRFGWWGYSRCTQQHLTGKYDVVNKFIHFCGKRDRCWGTFSDILIKRGCLVFALTLHLSPLLFLCFSVALLQCSSFFSYMTLSWCMSFHVSMHTIILQLLQHTVRGNILLLMWLCWNAGASKSSSHCNRINSPIMKTNRFRCCSFYKSKSRWSYEKKQ